MCQNSICFSTTNTGALINSYFNRYGFYKEPNKMETIIFLNHVSPCHTSTDYLTIIMRSPYAA